MKQKILISLLLATLTADVFAGCGNEAPTEVMATIEDIDVPNEHEQTGTEPTTTPDVEATAKPETEATPESSVTTEPEATSEPETTTEPEATAEPETTAEPKATAEPEATTEPEAAEAKPTATVYTYTDMNQTMWAKSSVNVRDLPSTDGNKVSSLKGGQEVTVTGRCNETGWYRLEGGSFVSGNYLVDSEPVTLTATSAQTAPEAQQGNVIICSSFEEAEALCDADDIIEIAEDGTISVIKGGGASVLTGTNEWSAGSSRDFINYLNQKRAEQGLAALEWDSTLEANAIARAQQLASDFSHNGGTYAENIAEINSDPLSIEAWYNAWYNSEGHRANMFSTGYVKAACAYYTNGSKSYVITVFQGDTSPSSGEQLQQQVESGELELISSETLDNGQTIDVYGTPGQVISVDKDMSDEEVMNYLKEIGWID